MKHDAPPPIDLRLEWHVLAHIHAGYLKADAVDRGWFTAERKLTFARLKHGTLAEWELATFDLLPALSDRDITEQVGRLRELARRRHIILAVSGVDAGLRADAMTADEACELLAQAQEAAHA